MRTFCQVACCLFLSLTAFCQEYSVLGIGDPIIDLIYQVDDSLLERLKIEKGGSVKIDFPSFIKLLTILPQGPLKIVPGGSCANTLKGLSCLGQKTAFIGKVGKDEMADKFAQSLNVYNITSLLISSEKNTSQLASLVTPDGQRTMRCCLGAANDLKDHDIEDNPFIDIKHLHMDGYMLHNDNVVMKSAKLAKCLGASVSIDLASFEVVHTYKKLIQNLLGEYIDIVFANEAEAKALTGLDPEEACRTLQEQCPIAVILVGKDGCWVGCKGQVFHCPTTPLEVIDSTGAGDLFASGFLHGFLENLPLETCAKYGNLTGGACVITVGAELPKETWEEVQKNMHE